MKNTIAIFFSLLVGIVTGLAQPMTDIRIVNEDQHSIVLEFTPQIKTEHVSGNQGTVFTRFVFSGSQTTYDSEGRTDFVRPLLLLLPSSQYSLQILASEYQTRDTVKLLPKPTMKARKDFGFIESYDDTSYARTALLPQKHIIAELSRVGKTSIGYVGTLLLHPVQALDKEKVRVYTRIVVRLDFKNTFSAGLVSSCLLRGQLPNRFQLSKMAKVSSMQSASADSPLWKGEWYRIEVTETGMYKLDYAYLKSLNSSINDINSIRLYGNGGLVIPDNNTDPRPNTLLEISRLVVDQNSNGILDPGDYIVFYGRGVRGWLYTGRNTFKHYINQYSQKNYYFLTFNQSPGKQMDTLAASAVSPSPVKPTSFQEKILVEDELFNLQNSGRMWVGELFSGSDFGTYNKPLPGLVASSRIDYNFRFFHKASTRYDIVEVFENNQSLKSVEMTAGGAGYTFASAITFSTWSTGSVSGDESKVKIQVTGRQDSKTWLDWMEILYERRFEAVNDVLLFTTIDRSSGLFQYDVSNLSGGSRVFDVTDHNDVKELKISSADSTVCQIQFQQTEGVVREIAVIGKNGYKVPSKAIKIENTINLHNTQSQYDFIVISPTDFLSSANQLKTHRESRDSLRTLVVDINHIYNEFSGGIPDILAIREFIRYTQDNWMSPPRYILLFGWGHFDYKNISSSQPNWIPPYEPEESLNIIDSSYPTDDKFAILDSLNNIYSVALGRIPVRSAQEASVAVNKIISYETYSFTDSSAWRNVLTFIADDGLTSEGDDGSKHTDQTEYIAESNTAKSFNRKKIYIIEYPTVNSASGRRKPNANKAIDDAINQGTLYTNFVGHGNEQLLTHEQIFKQDDDLPRLTNRERLTFITAATCNFSRYDDPSILSIGEQLVTMEQGGAIGTLGAARSTFPDGNFELNGDFFNYLFTKDSTGRNPRVGDAAWYAKYRNRDSQSGNTLKYHLFCDPTLRLLIPNNISSIDSVNGKSTSGVITIKSLAHVPIKGVMKLNTGANMTAFQGKGLLQVFDSERKVRIAEGFALFQFKENGSLLYRGGVTFQGGNFKATVPIPKDVSFGNRSRISMYAWNDATDGSGYTENVLIDGIDSIAASNIDTVGPQISIYLNDLDFRSGDVIKNNPTMIVKFHDESGINTSTAGVGHQLSATINNPDRTLNLSNYYQSDIDTYKSGEVRCLINDLNEGKYTLRVKAWDIQNNSSEAEIYFTISLADDLRLLNVVNYPNPFANSTTFTFQRVGIDPISVEVKIYSIAGRLIGKMNVQNITDRSVRIPWDGRDNNGDVLANGIYLYKLIVRSLDGQHTSEAIGKLAVIR